MVIAYALDSFDSEKVAIVGEVTRYAVLALFTVMFLASVGTVNRGGSLYSLWYSMTYVQFIRYIPIIDLHQSEVFNSFFSELYKIYNVYTLFPVATDANISQQRFKKLGFQGTIFINNAEEMLWAWGLCLALMLIIMIFTGCIQSEVMRNIMGYTKYSLIIRASLIVIFDIVICAVLQIYYADFQGAVPFTSTLISLMFLTMSALFVIFVPVSIKLKLRLTKEVPPEKCLESIMTIVGEFYGRMEMTQYLFYPIILLVRSAAAIILVLLYEYPAIQVATIGFGQVIILAYLFGYQPFKYHLDNWFVFATELLILLFIAISSFYLLSDTYTGYTPYLDIFCILIPLIGILTCLIRYLFASIVNGSWHELRTVLQSKNNVSEPTLESSMDFKDNYSGSSDTKMKRKVLNRKETEIKSQLPNEPYNNLYRDTSADQGDTSKNVKYFRETNGESWKVVEIKDPRETRSYRHEDDGVRVNYSSPSSRRNSYYGEGIPFYPRIAAKYHKYKVDQRSVTPSSP
ncbi:unnamed protein product [Blepharisma stoltei]|uniref:TRP C-terminal domain-containing protein n=1 Tax=Blepharisma stoltei TaxID=1481888 RepID=A0AAU9IBW4_9CILI|nr:unnamed protein product [Blepharisma stoltei]